MSADEFVCLGKEGITSMKITQNAVLALTSRSFLSGATLSLILFFSRTNGIAAGSISRTLQSFGVTVKHGQAVYPLPNNVALGLLNPDPLLDVAYFIDGKVQVWQNLGNGTFGNEPVFEQRVSGEVEKMEFKKSHMWTETIFDIDSWGDLYVTYTNGRVEKISHEWILNVRQNFASLPQASNNFPPPSFREVWRSPPNGQPSTFMEVGDIDNDGRNEVVYSQYGSSPSDTLTRLVVFENYGHGQYRVEWDTVGRLGPPLAITDIDNDGHKEIVTTHSDPVTGGICLLECYGPGQFRFYYTNIGTEAPTFKVLESDIDHNGVKELTVLTSNPSCVCDQTLIYVSAFTGKYPRGGGGWLMTFNQEIARYAPYTFNMAIGQVDGIGRDEIIPAGGSFGFHEPIPIDYLWRSNRPVSYPWDVRRITTGLEPGTAAVMFVNLDADSEKEFVSGAPGPIGQGSMFALKHVSDTTWRVMWADSSLRNSPSWVEQGVISGQPIIAGVNYWEPGSRDTSYTLMHIYQPGGLKIGIWRRDSVYLGRFRFIDIDHDGITNLLTPENSIFFDDVLKDYETEYVAGIEEVGAPAELSLAQNYPNPFNPETKIKFVIPRRERVVLQVFDLLGKKVETMIDDFRESGEHSVVWKAMNRSSGIYFYRLETSSGFLTRKMLLMR